MNILIFITNFLINLTLVLLLMAGIELVAWSHAVAGLQVAAFCFGTALITGVVSSFLYLVIRNRRS